MKIFFHVMKIDFQSLKINFHVVKIVLSRVVREFIYCRDSILSLSSSFFPSGICPYNKHVSFFVIKSVTNF